MSGLDKLKGIATGKRAPLIMGGLVAVAGYLWWTRRAPAEDTAAGAIDPETGEWVPGSASGSSGGTAAGTSSGVDYTGVTNPRVPPTIPAPPSTADPAADPADPPPAAEPETNDQWVNRAISYLMARLFTAEFAQTALVKAQFGEPLSVAEMAAVGVAFAGLGPPPNGFPPLGAAPIPLPGVPLPPPPVVVPPGVPPVDPLPPVVLPTIPNPGPIDPTPLPPVVVPPVVVAPKAPVGRFLALTQKFLGVNMGTSLVLDKLARDAGLPGVVASSRDRRVVNRTAIDKIWYAPQNAALRAKYRGDWTKINAGDRVWVPA